MSGAIRFRAGLARPLALLAVLAITTAWSLPHASAAGSAKVDAAAAAPRVAAAMSMQTTPRDDAFDGFAAAKAERTSTTFDTTGSSAASVSPAVAQEVDARAAAAATTSAASKKGTEPKASSPGAQRRSVHARPE